MIFLFVWPLRFNAFGVNDDVKAGEKMRGDKQGCAHCWALISSPASCMPPVRKIRAVSTVIEKRENKGGAAQIIIKKKKKGGKLRLSRFV